MKGDDIVLEDGRVGIGIRTPTTDLHVRSSTSGSQNDTASYPVFVDGTDQGIAIRVDGEANGDKSFVSFFDDYGKCGRIEGQTSSEYFADPVSVATVAYYGASCAALGTAIGESWILPDASDIIALTSTVAYTYFLWYWGGDHAGVAYSSGGGDYAEWLPRLLEDEEIAAGDIVGVYGGRVTKRTDGAQQILPISSNPIVLGNMPEDDARHLHERVSFMGQVPVRVVGPVAEGDFIIPSGLGDGTGIAIAPEMMTADEYAKVVGRAWAASKQEYVKLVNVAVGLDAGDVATAVRRQESETTGFKEALASATNEIAAIQMELETLQAQVLAFDDLAQEVACLRAQATKLRYAAESDDASVQVATGRPAAPAGH